ncbi:MAG: TadE/TadG family type IV pilus assembly protein [Ignavibacteriales bacterium]
MPGLRAGLCVCLRKVEAITIIRKRISTNEGKLVVETAIIFPLVFLTVIAVLYICMILFEKAYLQSLADLAAQRGSVMWRNQKKDIMLGSVNKDDLKKGGLYWQLIDLNNKEKEQKIRNYILARLGRHKLLMPAEKPNISVKGRSLIAQNKLEINIERKYKIPPGRVLKILGMTPYYTICVKSEAVIDQPTEFIRNTDLVFDIEKGLEAKYPEYGRAIRKIREEMNEIENDIARYFAGDEGKSD